MNAKSNSRKLTRSAEARPKQAAVDDETLDFADETTAKAYASMIKVQEENKTMRTWVICGTIVAGISIISYAALQRR